MATGPPTPSVDGIFQKQASRAAGNPLGFIQFKGISYIL